ncbi:N-6 DNA methylase [Stenotrophomonas sp.]|uniref:HsdM family class I SAM-dependent methyltransferase n=1 Tax=Stenotrophomonas sp. TaxID=69392 RepID=UPI0028AF4A83|nr:N-6 DNA methylase [Stenotrophomonas sp.]
MSEITLRSARATLAALKMARRCMQDPADQEAATHLLLLLVLLKVASDAQADRRAPATRGPAAPDMPPPAGARALEIVPSTDFERLGRAPLDGLAMRVRDVLNTFCLGNRQVLGEVAEVLDIASGLPGDAAMYRVLERLRIPALDFRIRNGVQRPDLAEATDQILGQAQGRRSREDGLHVPDALASVMVALLDPRDGERVYDPSCHHGCLLLACAGWAQQVQSSARLRLHGQEADRRRWAMARVRFLLHGQSGSGLEATDPLTDVAHLCSAPLRSHVQVALSRPPLTLRWDSALGSLDILGRFQHGIAPRQWAHMALIQHMHAQLDPQVGRMAVVVPNGVLFRDGEEAKIRRALLEANEVDLVISLPERLFKGTAMSTSLLVLRKARQDPSVLFIDTRPLLQAAGKGARMDDSIARQVIQLCQQRCNVSGIAQVVPVAEVLSSGAVLNVARHMHADMEVDSADPRTLRDTRVRLHLEAEVLLRELDGEVEAMARDIER